MVFVKIKQKIIYAKYTQIDQMFAMVNMFMNIDIQIYQ